MEILLFECRSVLQTTQSGTGNERVKVSAKNQKNIGNILILLEKWMDYKLKWFWMVFEFFWFCLTLSVRDKLKKSIFEMPIITQILNTNNLKNISATSITLHTIRKLVEYSLKKYSQKAMFIITVLVILLSESRPILLPTQRWTPSKGVKV